VRNSSRHINYVLSKYSAVGIRQEVGVRPFPEIVRICLHSPNAMGERRGPPRPSRPDG